MAERLKNMKKEKKIGKATLWTGSIAAAFVAAIAVFAVMLQMEKNILTKYEKGDIYVAYEQIPKGQMITEENYSDYLIPKKIEISCIPETALSNAEQISGLMAAIDIDPGTLLTQGMFRKLDTVLETMKEPVIAGFKAEDIYQVVSGVLRTGDYVHIYAVTEEGNVEQVWQKIFVQQVFDGAGNTIPNTDTATAAQRINIYLDKADVEQFYSELAKGSLRVVKVCE